MDTVIIMKLDQSLRIIYVFEKFISYSHNKVNQISRLGFRKKEQIQGRVKEFG